MSSSKYCANPFRSRRLGSASATYPILFHNSFNLLCSSQVFQADLISKRNHGVSLDKTGGKIRRSSFGLTWFSYWFQIVMGFDNIDAQFDKRMPNLVTNYTTEKRMSYLGLKCWTVLN
jgi:hypothetical protein